MIRYLIAISALAAMCASAYAQVTQQQSDPDTMLYYFFFKHVASADNLAADLKSKGKSDTAARGYFKTHAGLTDAESSLLSATAASCLADYQAQAATGVAAVTQLHATYPKVTDPPPSAVAQINKLQRDRDQLVQGCLTKLKAGMGPARFQVLDAFTRQTESPKIKVSTTRTPGGPKQ